MNNGPATNGPPKAREEPIPVIVFHGDRDMTVHPRNGEQVLAQCIERNRRGHGRKGPSAAWPHVYENRSNDCNGKAIAEQWIVHGAGHAWSGGSL